MKEKQCRVIRKTGAAVLAAAVTAGGSGVYVSASEMGTPAGANQTCLVSTAVQKSSVKKAQQAYQQALKQQKEAKQAYSAAEEEKQQARAAWNEKGFTWLCSKTENCTYEGMKEAVGQSAALASYRTSDEDQSIKDALSTHNLKRAVSLMKELNELRAKPDNCQGSVGNVKVDFDLMMFSAWSGYISEQTGDHTLFQQDIYDGTYAECLAWGYSDPFEGWYYEEKEIYDSNQEGVTGHYTIMTSPDYTTVGLTINSYYTSAMDFATGSANSVTVSEFESQLNAATAEEKTALDQASSAFSSAKADLKQANAALKKARKNLHKEKQKAAPDRPKITVQGGRRQIHVKISRTKKAVSYQIRLRNSGGSWKIISTKKRNYTVRGLKKGTRYMVQVRAVGPYQTKSPYSRKVNVWVR